MVALNRCQAVVLIAADEHVWLSFRENHSVGQDHVTTLEFVIEGQQVLKEPVEALLSGAILFNEGFDRVHGRVYFVGVAGISRLFTHEARLVVDSAGLCVGAKRTDTLVREVCLITLEN